MIEDEQGQWWILGYESGLWYYHDGKQWVQSEPPPVAQRREQAEALRTKGTTALSAGDWQTAIERFEAVLALEPDHAEASAGLAEARAQAQAQAQAEAEALAEAAAQPEPPARAEPETEAEVEAAPAPVRAVEPEVAPVVEERPRIRPAVREEAEAVPTAPGSRTAWIVAAVIVVIIVVIVLIQLLGAPAEQELGIWAERDEIQPGQCTLLHWEAPGLEGVRVVGPGIDSSVLWPPTGALEVCPEATSWYELKGLEWEELSRVQVHIGE
jgi:tetratricopeptide (TPR) repeat protein